MPEYCSSGRVPGGGQVSNSRISNETQIWRGYTLTLIHKADSRGCFKRPTEAFMVIESAGVSVGVKRAVHPFPFPEASKAPGCPLVLKNSASAGPVDFQYWINSVLSAPVQSSLCLSSKWDSGGSGLCVSQYETHNNQGSQSHSFIGIWDHIVPFRKTHRWGSARLPQLTDVNGCESLGGGMHVPRHHRVLGTRAKESNQDRIDWPTTLNFLREHLEAQPLLRDLDH